jgi:tetratricopeptide (TPR) repeat protein
VSSVLDRQRERFRVNPGDRRAFEVLEEALFVSGDWDGLVEHYDHRLTAPELVEAPAERALLLLRLGQVWEERHGDPDRAAECFRGAVAAEPGCRPALSELRRLHVARQQWDVALQIAEAEAGLEMTSADRADLLVQVARIWLDHLEDPEQALGHLERALEEAPQHAAALDGAARASLALGRSAEAASLWERLAAQLQGAPRAAAWIQQARLLAGPLGRAEQAAELYRRVLTEDPRNAEAVEALARIAKASGQWRLLADLLERRFELERAGPPRAELARQAGHLYLEHLDDRETARSWLIRAAELDSTDLETYRDLADLERERCDDAALLRALERQVELGGDEVTLSTLMELASLQSDGGDDEQALRHLQRALEIAPEDALVVEALSDTLTRLGRYDDLADCLERRAALCISNPVSHASALVELAALHEERRNDVDAARRAYERAMQANPACPGVAATLERIYRKLEAWEPLRGLLEQAARGGPREARAPSLCALGELLIEHFDDREGAGRAYDAALALDRGCAPAHLGRQRLATQDGDDDAILEAYQAEAAVAEEPARVGVLVRAIAPLHEGRGNPEQALAWAQRWAAVAPEDVAALQLAARLLDELGRGDDLLPLLERLDPLLQSGEQATNRRRLGELHAEAGRGADAIAVFRAALAADPTDLEAHRALVAQLEEAGRPEELASARRSLAELLPSPERAACLDALATLLAERLGDLPGAIDALVKLADLDGAPADVETRLESLLERTARFEELAARLQRRSEALSPGSEQAIDTEIRRARVLLEHLSRFEDAVGIYHALLERDPGCAAAREGLERGLRASGDTAGLAAFLAEQADSHPDPAAREGFALERAVILEEVLDRVEESLAIYQQLAFEARDPHQRERASQRLEALLERAGNWQGLRAHWERSLEACSEEEKGRVHERLGRLCRDRLRDDEAAVAHYEAAAALDPQRPELWHSLSVFYQQVDRPADLVRVLEAELATGARGERELAIRSRAAQLCTQALEDPERALPHYERVLELDPSDSTAGEFLIRHWEEKREFEPVVRILEGHLVGLDALPRDEAGDWAARRASLRLRIAGLRASELDDPDGAIAALEPALGEIGPQTVVAEPLADLYQRTGYAEDLIDLCERAASAVPGGAERAVWLARLAGALRGRGALRKAADAYRRALEEQPDDPDAKSALRDLYRRLGEAEPLTRLLEAELTHLAGPDEIPVRMELAKLLTEPLSRPVEALSHLRRVLQIDPGHAEGLERGLELSEQVDRDEVVRELLDAALGRPQPASARTRLLTRRGRLSAQDPERAAEAAADFREALGLEPRHEGAREALRSLLESTGDWAGVLDCLFQEACHAAPEERASIYERAADTAWQMISPDAALPWLERLRHERPRHAAVVARIAEAHRISGRPVARLRALEDQVELSEAALTRRDLRVEQARLLEHEIAAPGRAVVALEQARQLYPHDLEVLQHLDRLYRALGRDRERAGVLEAMTLASPVQDRVGLLCETANLWGGSLGEPRRAAALLLRAAGETPKASPLRAELLRALGEALRAAGPEDAWARCAEAELAALDADASVFYERRTELRRRLVASYRRQGRLDAALGHLRHLANEAPQLLDTTPALERALLDGLRAQGNPVELERRLAAHLERRPTDADGWLELARLRDEQLCSTAGAAAAYRRVLEADPASLPALRGLRSAAERLGEWEEVAESLEREIEHPAIDGSDARAVLLRRLGDVCWERLHSTTRASRCYAAALEARPEDFEAHRSLEGLLEAMGDWRSALDLYESEVEILGERDPERRREVWLRAGEIARDHTGETERALRAYVRADELGPLPVQRHAERAELHLRCGEMDAFAEIFESWCDDPAAAAGAADHLRLGETLEDLGRTEEALGRVERALEVDEDHAPAWDASARLHQARGDNAAAATALERAAALAPDAGIAERLLRAAELRRDRDPEGAAQLLRRAARSDPGSATVQCALAEVAAGQGDGQTAEESAGRALDLADSRLDPGRRLEIALLGGRAARSRDRIEAATRFFAAALEIDPQHPEALAGAGETLAALGDLAGARPALEARLALEEPDPECALHHALLARCLAAEDAEAALQHCEAAIREDPDRDEAHELCVSLHEAAGRTDDGVGALERWAEIAGEPQERCGRLIRAAEWRLREESGAPTDRDPEAPATEGPGPGGGCRASEAAAAAERSLREALAAHPASGRARERLASLLWEQGRTDEACELTEGVLDQELDPDLRGALALVRARSLERRGDREEAARAFGIAAEANPRCVEAATSAARLLRGVGEWRAAADALDAFARRHPGDDPHGLAEVFQQLGRLLAGPLEDLTGAVQVYRRAVELQPERNEPRTTLAQLLAHTPEAWREAIRHHRALLDRNPAHVPSLRAVCRIAHERGRSEAEREGLALLRALGVASPEEHEQAPPQLSRKIAADRRLEDPLWEALRSAVQQVAPEIGSALDAPEHPSRVGGGDAVADFRAAALAAEAGLTAPALLPLSTPELREVLGCAAALALEPEDASGSGSLLNALAEALSRRARRRLRRALGTASLEEIRAIDFAAWRSEVRALAAASTLDDGQGDLRTALVALVSEVSEDPTDRIQETADLSPLLARCPAARSLMRRAVRAWLEEI